MLAVVKANAYGHGLARCARVLAGAGVEWLGVTSVEEGGGGSAGFARGGDWSDGGAAAGAGWMSGISEEDADAVIADGADSGGLESVEQVGWLRAAAERSGVVVRVFLEIDSGMTRGRGCDRGRSCGRW